MTINEVAPPGFGHTKGDKKKGVKKGGTAAAFDRARKEGRFKGSKSDMFAIMWSQKKKGDKPHYKPGTNKKYKKYQEEGLKHVVDGEKYLKLPKKYEKVAKHKGDYRSALGKAKDAITDKLGKTNTDRDGVKDSSKRIFTMQNSYEPAGKVVDETVKDPTKKKPKAPQFNAAKELVTDAPYMKPALQQREGTSYKQYMADVQAAKDRLKKKVEDRKKKDAQFVDTRSKGVRFYDKKGKGRIVKGKKIYD